MNMKPFRITLLALFLALAGYLAWLMLSPGPSEPAEGVQGATTSVPISGAPQLIAATSEAQVIPSQAATIAAPAASSTVKNAFEVSGSAPPGWFSETSFPILVRDDADNVIGRGQAQAQASSTEPGALPFKAAVSVDAGYQGAATLILLKSNPSGLPENDDSIEEPIQIR